MQEEKCVAYLSAVPHIGRKTLKRILVELDKTGTTIVEWVEDERFCLTEGLMTERQLESFIEFKKCYSVDTFFEMLAEHKIRIITATSPEYPQLLHHVDDEPLVLYAKGKTLDNSRRTISIVGARKMTTYGKLATESLVQGLSPYNCTIVSGCMYGIDMCAHQAAMAHQLPTIGVLGFGFKHVFPSAFKKVFEEMLERGATLLTEFSPDTQALPGNFPVRNRIVAGMSLATVVVEAGVGSGSLITAQCAVDAGRVVGAVPGPFNSQYSEGTKWLINQGAVLVTSAEDILGELDGISVHSDVSRISPAVIAWQSKEEERLYEMLEVPRDSDDLMLELQLKVADFQSLVTSLELRNIVKRVGTSIERV